MPAEGSNGDNFCVPCISYRKNASMVKMKKNTLFALSTIILRITTRLLRRYIRRLIDDYG